MHFSNGLKLISCGTTPICARATSGYFPVSCPNTLTEPAVLFTRPVTIPIIVVLPAPFGPRSAKKSPIGTLNEIPFSASVPDEYVLARLFISRAGVSFMLGEEWVCSHFFLPITCRSGDIIGNAPFSFRGEPQNNLFALGLGRTIRNPLFQRLNLLRVGKRQAAAFGGGPQECRASDVSLFQNALRRRLRILRLFFQWIKVHIHKVNIGNVEPFQFGRVFFCRGKKPRVNFPRQRNYAMAQ